jgi:hypothetical protein
MGFTQKALAAKTNTYVGSSVGHGEDARASVLVDEVLISELGAVDGLATGACSREKNILTIWMLDPSNSTPEREN